MIGNVPFADLKLDYHGQKLSLHDYFFAKSVDALKPGGVLALVTTHFTLDKQNAAIREYLAAKADFVGAIRLPSDAFKREGTAVVTDILFLRKRAPGRAARTTPIPHGWASRRWTIEGMEIPINRYFLNHPEMVLGDLDPQGHALWTRATASSATAIWPGSSKTRSSRLPEFAPLQASPVLEAPAPAFTPPPPERHITEGSFFVDDDRTICQCVEGQAVPVVYGGTTLRAGGTHDRQAPCRPDRPARPRPPRPAIAERGLARDATAMTPAGNSTGPMTASSASTARSTRPRSAKPPTAASSAACPTS